MKKLKALIFALIFFFASSSYAYAVCDATETNELSRAAVNVRASYEEAQILADPEDYTPPDGTDIEEAPDVYYLVFRIYITNLTEDLYVEVYNDVTDETETYTYADSDNGTVTIDWDGVRDITNFTIRVYSSDNTNCAGTELHSLYLTTPRYNSYSSYEMCDGAEDFYLCYQYLTIEDVPFDEFVSSLERYKAGQIDDEGNEIVEPEPEEEGGFVQFLQDHLVAIIIIVVVVVACGVTVTVIIVKKQRSRIV